MSAAARAVAAAPLALALALAFLLALTACRAGGGGEGDDWERPQFRGVEVRVVELTDGDSWEQQPDETQGDRVQRVGAGSKLRVQWEVTADAADPEWIRIVDPLEELAAIGEAISEINALAASLPPEDGPRTAELQDRVRALDRRQEAFVQALVDSRGGEPLVDAATFTRILSGDVGPYVALAEAINDRRDVLQDRVFQVAADPDAEDRQTRFKKTVRAWVYPQAGEKTPLDVPGFQDVQNSRLVTSGQADHERLLAEAKAARKVVAMIRELRDSRDELRAGGLAARENARTLFEAEVADLRRFLDAWGADLSGLRSVPGAEQLPAEQAEKLEGLTTTIETARRLAAELETLRQMLGGAAPAGTGIDDLVTQAESALEDADALMGDLRSWSESPALTTVLESLLRAAGEELATEARSRIAALSAGLQDDLRATVDTLLESLPATAAAARVISLTSHTGPRIIDGYSALQETSSKHPIPQDLQDLRPAEIDLENNPVTKGDTVEVEIDFWESAQLQRWQEGHDDAEPARTLRYTSEVIEAGWVWSGDLIFTRRLDQASGESFVANAAVSREWRWFDRDEPGGWVSFLRPGLGFHAAQLNQDEDESAEFGVGVNASIFNGLIRIGVGYNLASSDDQEYGYVGFGLISVLNRLSEVGSKALGD